MLVGGSVDHKGRKVINTIVIMRNNGIFVIVFSE